MPFFTTRPDEQDEPHGRGDVRAPVPVRSSRSERAAEGEGRRGEDEDHRGGEGAELDHQDEQHQRGRDAEAPGAARGRPGAAIRTGRRLRRVAHGELQAAQLALDLLDRAAQVPPFQPRRDQGHLAQVLALHDGSPSPVATTGTATFASGTRRPSGVVRLRPRQVRGIEADRRPGSARARGWCGRAGAGRWPTSPSQAAGELVRDLLDGEAQRGRRPRDRSARWPRERPARRPTTSTTPWTPSTSLWTSLGQAGERSRSRRRRS